VTPGGIAIIAGTTNSTGINDFPVKPSSISSGPRSGFDGFLLALTASGGALVYSTYLGGSDEDHIEDLALDSRGQGVVIGWTKSIDFPITQAATIAASKSGGEDAFIAKVNVSGTALVFSTYLGGSGDDEGKALVLDPGGAIYVTGWTASTNFPTTANAYSNVNKGGRDCFVARIRSIEATPSLTLEYSTMIGGRGQDQPLAIAVDSSRNPYITGVTALDGPSNDYPINSSSPQGSWFVTKINPSGNNFDYSRYLGVNDNGGAASIQVDKSGNAYISGSTNSSSFELTSDAFTGSPRGGLDVAVVKLSPDGGTILHSSVIGGSNDDRPGPHASFLGQRGDLLVTGTTISRDFPTSRLSLDRTLNDTGNVNQSDAFLMRFEFDRRPFAVAPTARLFSPLRCDSVRLDTFYLYNTGDDTLKVTANVIVPQSQPFQIDSPATNLLPIRIRPGDSLRYIVRLTLKNPNTVTDTLLIYANSLLGKDSLPVVLTGTRIDPGVEVAPARILFPNLLPCTARGRDTALTIRGKSSDTATVTSIRLAIDGGGPFSLPVLPTLPKPLTHSSISLGLTLRFRPTRAGTFRDTLLVSIAECDQPRRIPIEGTRDSVGFYFAMDSLEFPPLIACRQGSGPDLQQVVHERAPRGINR
jgi:hypothetical protein